ncbi:hypothetical protein VTG60DRAFT_2853 [Thermothelomyces hinnuleus]
MADTALQERLRDHAKAFDGLLSLIPAKMYYGEDTSDQWRKKKQTKDQARAAKRGKLDPDSELNRNAKEVLDERARNKRKLREMESEDESESGSDQDDDDDSDIPGIEKEKPGEGLKKKKLKLDEEEEDDESVKKANGEVPNREKAVEEPEQQAGESTLSKRQKAKEEKKLAKKQKQEEAKRVKEEEAKKMKEENSKKGAKPEKAEKTKKAETKPAEEVEHSIEKPAGDQDEEPAQDSAEAASDDGDMAPIDVSGLGNENEDTSADSAPDSPVFDTPKNASAEPASTTTSISSAVPPSEKPKYLKIPADTTALRARLEAKLIALRAARKAADSEGKPIRTRQDLIEARRQKQAQRKAHKQEMRRLAKEEEERKREQALNSARNSPGLSPLFEQEDDRNANHFAFGRLAFSDGTQLSHDLSYEKTPGSAKKKGPSDPKTALLKLEAQKKRIANMDENKRKEVLEKETWLAARRRAEGEKVHDNESLLKKALKRKEKAKKKSEREWKERTESVKAAIQERQRKREENIRKRREEKLARKAGKKNKGVQTRKKNRPGFEGGFGGGRK